MISFPRASDAPSPTVLRLDALEEGLNEFDHQVEPGQIGLEPEEVRFDGPVALHVRVGRSLQMFTIEARLEADVAGECCRCLAPATASVRAEVQFLLQRKEGSDEEFEAAEEDDDVDLVEPGTKEIDLAPRLRDALLLELPLRLYCKTDCKGLCSQCGQDLNDGTCTCAEDAVDPRWDALAKLRS